MQIGEIRHKEGLLGGTLYLTLRLERVGRRELIRLIATPHSRDICILPRHRVNQNLVVANRHGQIRKGELG